MKILLVEDSNDQQEVFKSSVEVFNQKNNLCVEYEIAESFSDALNKMDGSYDGAIIDLRLGDDNEGGNKIVSTLRESLIRIPIIFVTAYTDLVVEHPSIIKKRARSDGLYEDDLLLFQEIRDTGLTHIVGGRGEIEDILIKVFLNNLLPQIGTWISYGKTDSTRTEKALLRHTLNHLLQILDDDIENCFPEEVYLHPPISDEFQTGSLVKEKKSKQWFAILNPACDIAVRENGSRNTDRILVVEIDSITELFPWSNDPNLSKSKKGQLRRAFGNNSSAYHHWLPKTDFFEGGFLNFRKLSSLEIGHFEEKFHLPPKIQISPPFVKDIVARFSSYYARQGQPNIDSDKFMN